MIRHLLGFCILISAGLANPVVQKSWAINQSFYNYLQLNFIDPMLITELDQETKDSLRTILAKTTYFEHRNEETGELLHALIPIGEELQISLYREKSGAYKVELIAIRYTKVIENITAKIGVSLQNDLLGITGNSKLSNELASIYDARIDFRRDIHKGDTISVVYERKVRLGSTHGAVTVVSSFIETGRRRHYAFYNPGDEGYYDERGNALASMFLQFPVSYRRITSGYQPSGRSHPILGMVRPHLGVDFGAPMGTPVTSVADGVVRFVGCQTNCNAGYGKLVVIEHKNGWETRYAHLKGYGRNVSFGARVSQGQTIGFLGASGVTTGPHLHFELRKFSQPTNPLALKNVRQQGLKGTELMQFIAMADKSKIELDYFADTAHKGVARLSYNSAQEYLAHN